MLRFLFPLILSCVLLTYVASALYIHFRGKVRHRFVRQLSDHSTIMAPYNAMIYFGSGVPNTPVLDLKDFPDLKPLRDNWETIRDEARRLYDAGHIQVSTTNSDLAFNTFFKRGWKRFYLKWYGEMMPSAADLCPKTCELVKSIPSVNAALFALLSPRSKLGAHRDPFAGSIRYHLGLMTPNSDDCRIYVDGTALAWRDGEAILFDETYIHSVRNDTDKDRLILFCDIARPIKNPVVRVINNFVTQHIVKATQAQNVPTEKVGILNRVSKYVFSIRENGQRLKKKSKALYMLMNAAIFAVVVGGIVLVCYFNMRRLPQATHVSTGTPVKAAR